jgi:hypothetical protein
MARAGKYDAVLPGLPKLPPSDLDRQEKIEQAKREITNRDAVALADGYIKLRAVKDEYNEVLSTINLRIEAYEQLLAESQEAKAEGWGRYGVKENALRLPTGDTVRIQLEPYGKVVDKDTFREWCLEHGYGNQLQLWPSTMNAIVKERLLAGEPEPDGTEAYAYTKIVLVKKGEQ